MAYKKLLVAVDFSDAAIQVIKRAGQLAKESGATLTLLHVVEFLPPLDFAGDPITISFPDVDEKLLVDNAKQSLQKFVDQHLDGLPVEQKAVVGIPKVEIADLLEKEGMDLLVIGSHGRHGFARLLGSTAAAVLNDCPCDVLAVRIKE